ncbi:MAG: nitronate monooxygenase, partial [Chloroflexi bacterium]|nr:nitronate monooxygenase [Chloroflexota bacterium]
MANHLHTPLCDFLGIEYPIILAGMAVGRGQATAPTPMKLVAEVSNAGGLGVMGDNFHTLDELDAGIKTLRSLVGDRPFGVDFLLPATRADITESKQEVYAQIKRDYPKHVAVVESLIEEHGLKQAQVSETAPMST